MLVTKRFLLKRILLPGVILLTVIISNILPATPAHMNVYASDMTPMFATSQKAVSSIVIPDRPVMIVSSEIVQKIAPTATPTPTPEPTRPWGKATQVDEHTWTMNVGSDDHMADPQEILTALNLYRQAKGRGALTMDMKLKDYAQTRSDSFNTNHGLDGHAGFQDFVNHQDGFSKLGFHSLGENSSIGYHVIGTHLIEWVYAGDKPHDDNQLSSDWTYVGIGVTGDATDLVFGGRKQ